MLPPMRPRPIIPICMMSADYGIGVTHQMTVPAVGRTRIFCQVNFDVDFPLTEKVHVKGEASHPLFAWLRQQFGPQAGPRWNFHKYLIGPDGRAVAAWPSAIDPDAPEITAEVERLLPAT